MRVLVTGGRDYNDLASVVGALNALNEQHGQLTIIQGGATGADQLARYWADRNFCQRITEPADWKAHGKAAGPIRNQRMLDEHKPDLVLAFDGGRGTADMIRRAEAAGIPVQRVARVRI